MTDRPIIFSAPMVRALLAGRKTQTRRLLKPQPVWSASCGDRDGSWSGLTSRFAGGDRLLVREAFNVFSMSQDGEEAWPVQPLPTAEEYREVEEAAVRGRWLVDYASTADDDGPWRPSIHMPRWASRLTLPVTDVRVQRLQDITEDDALAEGVCPHPRGGFHMPGVDHPNREFPYLSRSTPRGMFAALWDTLHGPGAWEDNPWVVAISFTVHHGNIDQ
jgi:hypothetical protein